MVKTKAIILKTADLGEADRLLTIYSKEFGKIRVIARGVKKVSSKLRYHLEPLSYSQFILVEGKQNKIVKDSILMNQFLSIKKDLNKVKTAYKIVDLIDQLIVGEEKDDNIWELILQVFKIISKKEENPQIVEEFRNSLLKLLGYDPKHVKNLNDIY